MVTAPGAQPTPERSAQLQACRDVALEAAYGALPGVTPWELFLVFASAAASVAKKIGMTAKAFRVSTDAFYARAPGGNGGGKPGGVLSS
jgi:hypothetical protein